MVLERDINILRDELLYVNSRGKKVKKLPRECLGAFYYFEAAYKDFLYGTFRYIPPQRINDSAFIKITRQVLLDKVIAELTVKMGK